jgi:hypothetical protein
MAPGPTPLSDVVGGLYHYWVSACFGLTYALITGRTQWWGGLIWGLIIHGFLNGVFIGSLIPHISYGIALGLLLQRYVRHAGTVFGLVGDAVRPQVPAPPIGWRR